MTMIKIKFEKKYGFRKKPYSLVEGLEVLADLDADFNKRNQNEEVYMELFDTKDKDFGYKGYFELGLENGDSFLEWLEKTLMNEFPNNSTEIQEMIDLLTEEIAQQALSAKEIPIKSNKPRKRSPWIISGVIIFILLLGGVGAYFLMGNQIFPITSAVETKETFREDLQLLVPKELAAKYPDQLEEIAEYYKDNQNWDKLKMLQETHPTASGAFDLAFYERDWDTVIQTDVTTLTEERKIMLCFAYIEKNMIFEAELLAKKLDSDQLNEALDYAYLHQIGSLIKEKKLNDVEDIGKKIQSAALQKEYQESVDSAHIMNDMIDLYQKQKDTKNKEIWERRLNDLGTALEERRLTK
ncbi:hypothetical protein [Enterococcus gallinarum]|nr:hypothetical protein [Enterococcus gallinarum]UXA04085.1 hypothetical protein KW861_16400 [Enterococcus gallinarum]